MDKALKIGKLFAYVAEIVMATFVVIDTVENISERRAKENVTGMTADAVPESNS